MKNIILITVFCILTISAWTQNSNFEYKYALKIYNMSTFEFIKENKANPNQTHYISQFTISKFLNPTIAFQWKSKKNHIKEIELTDFNWDKQTTLSQVSYDSTGLVETVYNVIEKTSSISLRYEYELNFNKKHDFVPGFGFGVNPYYLCEKLVPKKDNLYKSSSIIFGTNLFIIPRFTYFVNSRIYLDLNIPFSLVNLKYSYRFIDNPQLPYNQRKVNTVDFEELQKKYYIRIGIGLKL